MLRNLSRYKRRLIFLVCCLLGYAIFPLNGAVAREFLVAKEGSLPELMPPDTTEVDFGQFNQGTTRSTDYILGSGDELSVAIVGYPEFSDTHRILPDGTISLPLIGPVQASGQTLRSLSQLIKEQLGSAYLVNPVVDLSLLTLRPVSVTISGEVNRPGPLQLDGLQNDGSDPTLVDALIEAGGVTNFADIREVIVRRVQSNGQIETVTLNFWDALVSEPTAINLMLRDGDVIIVPRLSSEESLDRTLIARSSIAPGTVKVKVVGEVTRPGEVEVSPASSLSSAIATAGGPTEDAKLSEVSFIRVNPNGANVTSQVFDLSTLTDSFQVQDGDVIIVPKTNVSSGLELIGRLVNPNRLFTDIFRLFDQ